MRSHLLKALLTNIDRTTPEPHRVYVMGTAEVLEPLRGTHAALIEDQGQAAPSKPGIRLGSWGNRLNRLYPHTDEPFLFLAADDVKFQPGWSAAAFEVMRKYDGVVSVNDRQSEHGTLALVSRNYLETEGATVDDSGAIIHEGYHHVYSERELFETAVYRRRFGYARHSVVEHMHHLTGKSPFDEVYAMGDASWDHDEPLFLSRRHLWHYAVVSEPFRGKPMDTVSHGLPANGRAW